MAEKLSVVMARRNIRMAHVTLLVIDATEGPVGSDATIGGYAHEEGRALVICVNKWDVVPKEKKKGFEQAVRDQFKFLDYAPIVFLSAANGTGIPKLLKTIQTIWKSYNHRVGTGELNRFVESLIFDPGRRIYYMTQPSVRPPTFVLFSDKLTELHFSKERFLINRLREQFGFEGTPVVLKLRARH